MLAEKSFTLGQANSMPADLLDEMLLFIVQNVPSKTNTHELHFKSKYVLTELLTNAIKHADCKNLNIRLEITDKLIRFIKTDDGNPFPIPNITNNLFKNARIITADIMHTLYAVERSGRLYFYCYENAEPVVPVDHDFPEHFGLLIITKASDEFYYAYDPDNGINIFTAVIGL